MDELIHLKGNQGKIYNEHDLVSAIKDYLDISLFNKAQSVDSKTPNVADKVFRNNEDFWINAIEDSLYLGQNIRLEDFKVLEWIPSSPGLFYKEDAKRKRESAIRSYREWEKRNFNSFFRPQKSRKVVELRPDEKRGMIQGGYGSLRIAPKVIDNELQYILCFSSNGVSHEGIIGLLKKEHYSQIVDEIKKGKVPIVNLTGRLMALPKELSPVKIRYERAVPRYYIEIEEIEISTFAPMEFATVSVAITYSRKDTFMESDAFSYSFCTFSPNQNNRELRQAIFWLQNYAERYSKDKNPIIIGDFDEKFDHFGNVQFPIKDVANGRISLDKLHHLKEHFHHFQINELYMGDKNEFNNSQIGAVGSNAISTNNSFQQMNYSVPEDLDYEKLTSQLTQLREKLVTTAKSPEEFKAISEVAEAEGAAKKKNGNKVVKHLKDAGSWVFDNAKDIGVEIVTELIKKQMEI